MDTVNRALDSASHAIWGETHPEHQQHGEEPLSGVQGQGSATDPYDAGNRDGEFCHFNLMTAYTRHHLSPNLTN